MATDKRQFTLRMQPENIEKIKVIAAVNKRSMAMQIEYWSEEKIAEYEHQNGTIQIRDSSQQNVIQQHNYNGDNILSVNG